ncbi:MAG: hypothetical protein V3U27_14625, partial [Candidatus Tectomicrobia bacterium]
CTDPALRRALVRVRQLSRLEHPGVQPLADQSQYSPIIDPPLDKLAQAAMVYVVERSNTLIPLSTTHR